MNRLLLLRPVARALRATPCSRGLSAAQSRNFGATSAVRAGKKVTQIDDIFFGGEETEPVRPAEPVKAKKPAQAAPTKTPAEVQQADTDYFGFLKEETLSEEQVDAQASSSEATFDPNAYFASWMTPEARDALESRNATQQDYICTLLEAETVQDMLSELEMSEAEDFERLWGLYDWKKKTDPQAVIPILTFLLRHGVHLKAPSLTAANAEECVEGIQPELVKESLQSVNPEVWRIDDSSKPPSKMIPYPDLMEPDHLLDPRDVVEFPATPDTPFDNRVIVRNHRSVFHDYGRTSEDDLLEEDDISSEAQGPDQELTRSLPVSAKYYQNLHQSILMRRSVVQQTGKGKIRRVAYIVLVGDGNGLVGYGEGKHGNSSAALRMARMDAVRNMDWVARFEKRTIWTEMSTKLGATQVLLRPRPVGFGLRCNPYLHQILRAAGLKDISGKVWGSRNKLNVIKAAFRMLHAGHAPTGMGDGIGGKGKKLSRGAGVKDKGEIERARGRRLISLRK